MPEIDLDEDRFRGLVEKALLPRGVVLHPSEIGAIYDEIRKAAGWPGESKLVRPDEALEALQVLRHYAGPGAACHGIGDLYRWATAEQAGNELALKVIRLAGLTLGAIDGPWTSSLGFLPELVDRLQAVERRARWARLLRPSAWARSPSSVRRASGG